MPSDWGHDLNECCCHVYSMRSKPLPHPWKRDSSCAITGYETLMLKGTYAGVTVTFPVSRCLRASTHEIRSILHPFDHTDSAVELRVVRTATITSSYRYLGHLYNSLVQILQKYISWHYLSLSFPFQSRKSYLGLSARYIVPNCEYKRQMFLYAQQPTLPLPECKG